MSGTVLPRGSNGRAGAVSQLGNKGADASLMAMTAKSGGQRLQLALT